MGRTCVPISTSPRHSLTTSTLFEHGKMLICDKKNIKYIWYVIEYVGIHVDPNKVQILKYWPIPQKIIELRSFLGLENFYRWVILHFNHIARPLNKLTKGNGKVVFKWTSTNKQTLEQLKHKICIAPVLVLPNLHQPLDLETNTSGYALGAMIT